MCSLDIDMYEKILNDILAERKRQARMWGKQVHPYPVWLTILVEEVGEVAEAVQFSGSCHWSKGLDANDLYKELIQVAAVATAIAEQVIKDEEAN